MSSIFLVAKDGNFSYVENNIVYVGDGETVTLGVNISEGNVNWDLNNIDITKIQSVSNNSKAAVSGNSKQFKIINSTDIQEQKYYISEFYAPYSVEILERDEKGNALQWNWKNL